MLLEAGERDTCVQVLARQLEDMAGSGNSVVVVAEICGDLAGYVELAVAGSAGTRQWLKW